MVFHWQISLITHMDAKTGLPMVGEKNPVPYNPEEHSIPEKYRPFLTMTNPLLHPYIDNAEPDMSNEYKEKCQLPVHKLIRTFPDWSDVIGAWDIIDIEDWTEENHTLFKEALEWMASKKCFMASWSC
jgi:hypothetical protein